MTITDSQQPEGPPVAQPQPEPEPPPPGVKTMALVRWVLVAIMATVAAATLLTQLPWGGAGGADQAGADQTGVVHYCPMHPQIQQPGPGECPICNMTLVPRPAGAVRAQPTMTPARASSDAGPAPTAGALQRYRCPMHPEVISADPQARCPRCGMKLEPVPGGTPAAPAAGPPSTALPVAPVPGLVPVDLTPERIQLIGIRTERAQRSLLGGQVRTVGAVEADERGLAQITTRFSGWVEQLLVAETGQRVRKGQVLATIYSPEVLQAQEELLSAIRWAGPNEPAPGASPAPPDHPGHQDRALAAGGGAAGPSQSLVADARHRLELLGIAPQEIEAISRERRPHRAIGIRSPVDGHAVGRHVLPGMAVQPGMALFEVADLNRLWVLADVYEADAARMKVGQAVRFTVAAYPGQTWPGKVQFIYPLLESGSRTLRLRVQLDTRPPGRGQAPDPGKLRPGMFGDVVLDLPGHSAVSVPAEAVVDTGQLQYLFVAREGGRFEPRRVQLGVRAGDRVEVKAGLAEHELVVTSANFLIDSESRLRAAIDADAGRPQGAR